MERKLSRSFMVWPVPVGPVWVTRPAKASRTGRARATTSGSPPTITSRVPAWASAGVRPRGASMRMMPADASSAASRMVTDGSEVEQSMTRSGLPAAASPSGPWTMAWTSGDPVTHRTTMSDCSATSLGLVASLAPRSFRFSTGSRLRWPMIVRGQPLSTMFPAMPWPMSPTPINPIRSFTINPIPPDPASIGKHSVQFVHRLAGERPRGALANEEEQFGGLLQLLAVVHRLFQGLGGHDGTVIGEQHGGMLPRHAAHRFRERPVAGPVIGQEGKPADPHHVIGGERRQDVGGILVAQAGHRHRMGAVEMHHRPGQGALLIDRQMKEGFLRRRVAGNHRPVRGHLGNAVGIEEAHAGIGRRHQDGAVVEAHGHVPRRSMGETAPVEDRSEPGDGVAQAGLAPHGRLPGPDMVLSALLKKS